MKHFENSLRGGGLRLLASLLAIAALISFTLTSMSTPAKAATDRWYQIGPVAMSSDGTSSDRTITRASSLELVSSSGGCNNDPENVISGSIAGTNLVENGNAAKGYVEFRNIQNDSIGAGVGLDNDGIAHYLGNGDIPIRSYRFSQIKWKTHDSYQADGLGKNIVCLYGHKVADTQQSATTVQVPTTGAPSSDMVLPVVAVALGVAGVAYGLTGRRRRD